MAVLLELATADGNTVPREHLTEAVWPRGFVTDGVLSRCISQLRAALGDDSRAPRYIATIPRKGYRLVADVIAAEPGNLEGILVLPFLNLAAHGKDEYLADGLTELLIARLAVAVNQRVVSRTTAMTFKNAKQDMEHIRKKLGVMWVVEGSLFQLGDDLQIIVQLIDVERDAHTWANTWTRPAGDIMNVLNEVTRHIATQARVQLDPLPDIANKVRALPLELEHRYLQGMHHVSRRSTPALQKAISCFEEVLQQYPDHAPVHAGMAFCHILLAHYGAMNVVEGMRQAATYACRALEIDPDNPDALTHMGAIQFSHEWNFEKAQEYVNAALRLKPNYEMALLLSADIHLVKGHYDRSQSFVDLAITTDPLNVGLLMNAGDLLILQRRYPEAIRSLAQALELEPGMRPAHLRQALAYALHGKSENARNSLDRALEVSSVDAMYLEYRALVEGLLNNTKRAVEAAKDLQAIADTGGAISPWPLARAWAMAGDEKKAIAYLEQAYNEHSSSMPFLGQTPVFDNLRNNTKVRELMDKIGIPAAGH